MKRIKQLLASVLACLMIVTSLNWQTMQVEAAPDGTYSEVSIFDDSAYTVSSGDSGRGSGDSYNGWILNFSDYGDADYLKIVFTIGEGVNSWDWVMALQPHNSDWSANSYLGVYPSLGDYVDGKYTIYYSIADIEDSLNGASCDEVTLIYTSATCGAVVEDVLLCTEVVTEIPPTSDIETSILSSAANATASDDASRVKEDGSTDLNIIWYDDIGDADFVKIAFTVEEGATFNSWDYPMGITTYNSNYEGWKWYGISYGMCDCADGVYTCNVPVEDLDATLNTGEFQYGECYGINVYYNAQTPSIQITELALVEKADNTTSGGDDSDDVIITDSASLDYVKAMGDGWNLGNSFDGVNTALDEEDLGETAWGNPVVTKELIQAAADKGYDSIRIPITFYRRFDEETYVLDEDWLARCKEVIQWALDENLYVMINVHHDSWIWLEYWDGNKESEEYKKFTAIWEQFAEYFKDMPEQVCFETINEPVFEASGEITAQDKLDMVNQAAYDAIRNSGGNNATRMIVIPTYTTNHGDEHCEATIEFIQAQEDENLIATVHYYSEWVHSAGIGKTGFDEVLWDDYTPRDSVDLFYETLQKQFLNKGIGVIVGEWGLLGYDSASQVNQAGEELKYYEYMNYYANETDVCLMFWDNGSGISRTSGDYSWKKPLVGEMLETSMSERSAYVKDLDRVFLAEEAAEDVSFPLTLNGLTFTGVEGLTEGTDYTYDEATSTVTLSKNYVNAKFAEIGDAYGTFAELVFKFSSGADWHEYLIKYAAPVMEETTGTVSDIKIPVEFNGSEVRRATAYMASGKVGPNSSWWDYLQYGGAFLPDYEAGTIAILSGFWDDPTVVDGEITFHFEMYDGSVVKYVLVKDGNNVTGSPAVDSEDAVFECATEICVYVGETEIKDTYFNIPKGTSVYGAYTTPENAANYVTLEGWPHSMIFGSVAQEDSIIIGLRFDYLDRIEYAREITFWLKDAPVVEAVTVEEDTTASVVVKNLAEGATVTYEVADATIATVSEAGAVMGVKAGTTKITATVTQYGRTDSFEATVTVEAGEEPETTQSPTTTEEPGTTEAPATTEAPTTTEEPETTQAPTTTEAPQPTQTPGNACGGQLVSDQNTLLDRLQDMLTDADREAIENGTAVNVILRVVDAMNTIAQSVRDAFTEAASGEAIGMFLDITMGMQIGNGPERDVHELSGNVSISVVIPENLRNNNANVNRTYHVWRSHNGVIERLASAYDAATNILIFDTDGFSDYAITYVDTAIDDNGGDNNSNNATSAPADTTLDTVPKTGDTYELFFWMALMVIAGVGIAVYGFKNRKETSEE